MPVTDEDILRDLMRRCTDDLRAPSGVAAGIVARDRRRHRNVRVLSVAGAGVAAGAVAVAAAGIGSAGSGGARHESSQHASSRPVTSRPATALPTIKMPDIKLTAAQRVLYRLSAAAAAAPRQAGRYVELTEIQRSASVVYPKDLQKMLRDPKTPLAWKRMERALLNRYGAHPPVTSLYRTSVIDTRTGDTWTYQKGPGVPSDLPVARHGSPTAAQFARWPTAPAGLRALLVGQAKQLIADRETIAGDSMNSLVFVQATNWLWNPLLSPALRSAMYKVLADTPGVVVKTGVTDTTGRPAIEISQWDGVAKQDTATFEDPATGAVLESLFTGPQIGTSSDVYQSITSSATLPPSPYSG
jgi:hypothetical protein